MREFQPQDKTAPAADHPRPEVNCQGERGRRTWQPASKSGVRRFTGALAASSAVPPGRLCFRNRLPSDESLGYQPLRLRRGFVRRILNLQVARMQARRFRTAWGAIHVKPLAAPRTLTPLPRGPRRQTAWFRPTRPHRASGFCAGHRRFPAPSGLYRRQPVHRDGAA